MNKYDPINHKYYINEKETPNVTGILQQFGYSNYSKIPAHILENASTFGTAVHELIRLFELNQLGEFDEQLMPYLEQWKLFKKENNLTNYILDIKTSNKAKWHRYQLSGYSILIEGCQLPITLIECPIFNNKWMFAGTPDIVNITKISKIKYYNLYIKSDKYKLEEYDLKHEIKMFKKMLEIINDR